MATEHVRDIVYVLFLVSGCNPAWFQKTPSEVQDSPLTPEALHVNASALIAPYDSDEMLVVFLGTFLSIKISFQYISLY